RSGRSPRSRPPRHGPRRSRRRDLADPGNLHGEHDRGAEPVSAPAARQRSPVRMFDGLNTGNLGFVGLIRVSIAVLLVIGAAALGVLFTRYSGEKDSKAAAAAPAKSPTCESRLLHDWSDGRIDGTYPVTCYRAALR